MCLMLQITITCKSWLIRPSKTDGYLNFVLLSPPLMPFSLLPAFKETAFLLAVSSAALTHALAKACSSGRMERCTCDDSPGIQHREAWQWGVCGDNLKYSTKFLKKFLGQKRVSKDLRAKIDAHNINVGIRVSECEHIKKRGGALHQILRLSWRKLPPRPKASKTSPTPWATLSSISWAAILHDNYTSDTLAVPSEDAHLQSPPAYLCTVPARQTPTSFAAIVGPWWRQRARQRSRETRRLWERWSQVFPGMIKLAVRAYRKLKVSCRRERL